MKSSVETSVLDRGGLAGEKAFGIVFDPKMAKILSDGLYADKIGSIIREISCNAVDAHVQAGKRGVPFEVHLPNTMEPWFSVQDWGVGLDPLQIRNIFTVYGCSTKTETNDAIGQLGLGSKSPFSYTDAFTVTSVKDGRKNVYSMFRDETGMPTCAAMGTGDSTTEENGVKVEIPVNVRDFHEFAVKARAVYKWFDTKPRIVGQSIKIEPQAYNISGTKWKIPTVEGNQYQRYSVPYALMGNVAYPIDIQVLTGISDQQRRMLALAPVFDFDIGDLEVSASRESLGYDKRTIDNILKVADVMFSEFVAQVNKEFDACESLWQAKMKWHMLGYDVLRALGNNHKFFWRGTPFTGGGFEIKLVDIYTKDQLQHNPGCVRTYHSGENRARSYTHQQLNVTCDDKIFIVFDDLKLGAMSRVQAYDKKTRSAPNLKYIVLKPGNNKTPEEICEMLGNPTRVLYASKMDKPDVVKRDANNNVSLFSRDKVYKNGAWVATDEAKWSHTLSTALEEDSTIDLDDGGFFIPTNRSTVCKVSKVEISVTNAKGVVTKKVESRLVPHASINSTNIGETLTLAVAIGILPKDIKVYTGRGTSRTKMIESDKWIDVVEHIEKALDNFDKTLLVKESTERKLLRNASREYFAAAISTQRFAALDSNKSLFARYIKEFHERMTYYDKAVSLRVDQTTALLAAFDRFLSPGPTDQVPLYKMRQEMNKQYPMLFKVTQSYNIDWSDKICQELIVDYINMVDDREAASKDILQAA